MWGALRYLDFLCCPVTHLDKKGGQKMLNFIGALCSQKRRMAEKSPCLLLLFFSKMFNHRDHLSLDILRCPQTTYSAS